MDLRRGTTLAILLGGLLGVATLAAAVPVAAAPALNTPQDCPQLQIDPAYRFVDQRSALIKGELSDITFPCSLDITGSDASGYTDYLLFLPAGSYEDLRGMVASYASAEWQFQNAFAGDSELGQIENLTPDTDTSAGIFVQMSAGSSQNPLLADIYYTPNTSEAAGAGRLNTSQDGMNVTIALDSVEYVAIIVFVPPGIVATPPPAAAPPISPLAEPSILSNLQTAAEAVPNPTQGGVIAGSAVALMLVVGYPGYLLSTVISGRYDRLVGNRLARVRAAADAKPWRRRLLIGAGLVVASIVTGFLDPEFGVNPWSVRLVLTALAAFVVLNLGGAAVIRAVMRRLDPTAPATLEFRWGSVVILAIAVVICRLLSFDPGVIFGLVAGLTFGAALVQSQRAAVVLVGSGFAAAVGILAWVGYSLVAPVESAGSLGLISLKELFAALTIEGIATLPLALLPFAALDGAALRAWKLPVWIAAYAVAVALFVFVLVSLPDSWGGVSGDLGRWTIIFAAFSVVAVAVWLLDRRFSPTRPPGTVGSSNP